MNDEEVRRSLDQLGRQPGPVVSEKFAEGLESQLRVTAAEIDLGGSSRRSTRPLWQPVAALAVAAVLVLAGSLALFRTGQSESGVLVMSAAQGTEVILPSGSVVSGSQGLALPDGSRIEVGPSGSATVNDVVLSDGAIAVVTDGRLEIVRDDSPVRTTLAPTSTPSSPPSTRQSTTSEVPTTVVETTLPPITDRPAPTDGVTTSTVTTPPTSPVTRETLTTQPSRLNAVLVADPPRRGEVVLKWTIGPNDAIAGWEVKAQRGDAIRTVAVIREPANTSITVAQPESGSVQYWVLTRSADGVIGESNRVEVAAI